MRPARKQEVLLMISCHLQNEWLEEQLEQRRQQLAQADELRARLQQQQKQQEKQEQQQKQQGLPSACLASGAAVKQQAQEEWERVSGSIGDASSKCTGWRPLAKLDV
jgi:DNA repair exonuclease SbcCD ATPase subunit